MNTDEISSAETVSGEGSGLSPHRFAANADDAGVCINCGALKCCVIHDDCRGDGSIRFGKWTIHYDPPPIPVRDMDWEFAHDDYDASWEGEEDGWVSNGLGGREASVEACKDAIIEMEMERCGCREATPASCLSAGPCVPRDLWFAKAEGHSQADAGRPTQPREEEA